jgi:hypothetical protein
LFKERYGMGQKKLFNVLKALSLYLDDCGYVQGMGYITALLLTYMDEKVSYSTQSKDAFWCMITMMNNYELKSVF